MFYSTEILTSRKYGVATVWLVATLGSKSTLKKVSRKAILDVDVEKACQTIVAPEAPMALRLQSNLLYGVVRVYAQQCNYILTDAEAARTQIRSMYKTMATTGLDAEGGHKGRKEQLVIADDPNFDIDLMPIDLDRIDFDVATTAHDSQRSTLSPHSSQMSLISNQYLGDDLMIPPSASSFVCGAVGGGLRGMSVLGDSCPGARARPQGFFEDDLGISIEADGTMVLNDEPAEQLDRRSVQISHTAPGSASSRVRRDHEEGQLREGIFELQDDGYMPMYDDDLPLLPGTEPFPRRDEVQDEVMDDILHTETTSESAAAPLRTRRTAAKRILAVDSTAEVRNSELAKWNSDYLANMKEAARVSDNRKAAMQAKKNAEHWVFGGILREYGAENGPLSMFSGHSLLKATMGNTEKTKKGKKRALEMEEDDDTGRRVRPRGEETANEFLRGLEEDGFNPLNFDDDTIELGREAPTPLDERHLSSAFPWNQNTGLHRPSVLHSAGGVFPTSGSIGGGGGAFGPFSRRSSCLVSASPLHGRGIGGTQLNLDGDDSNLQLGSNANPNLTDDDAFELFGPAADVDTQTAAQSQWQRAILDGEGMNFLAFVQAGIDQADQERSHASAGDEEDDTLRESIDFETLLPPASSTCVVAAQALLHVLTLGTKNLIEVEQEEAYGPISLRVGAAAQ